MQYCGAKQLASHKETVGWSSDNGDEDDGGNKFKDAGEDDVYLLKMLERDTQISSHTILLW